MAQPRPNIERKTMAALPFLLLLSFLCCFGLLVIVDGAAASPRYAAILSFGDSLADTGNFLLAGASTFPGINRLPYGMTYFGHPTGRCSDGRLVVDFIAQAYGLPLLPPYLKPGQSFRHGVNFAFAGATALDMAFYEKKGMAGVRWSNNSMSIQLGWFDKLKPSLCQTRQACKTFFGKSLFLVGEIGGNDYNYALFSGKTMEEVRSYVPRIVGTIVSATEKLIGDGAVELIVPGVPPLGCSAVYLTLFNSQNSTDYDSRTGCLKQLNSLTKYHNMILQQQLYNLRKKHPKAKIVYADYYGATIRLTHVPKQSGFVGGLKACCGGGGPYNFDVAALCGQQGSATCKQPQAYANWDGVHLTEAAYHNIAMGILKGPFSNPPLN